MNMIVAHFASGHAFYSGLAFLVAALVISHFQKRIACVAKRIMFVLGVTLVVLSSTPLPLVVVVLLIGFSTAWLIASWLQRWVRPITILAVLTCLAAGLIELPYSFSPTPPPVPNRSVTVIGDSLSAGTGEVHETTWPTLLAERHDIDMQDLSHVGETAGSALERAEREAIRGVLVVVEIGGNDLLGQTTAAQFERDLDALLTHVKRTSRTVVMFELPLPPFFHRYGRVQRRLAAKHGVSLIPKRVLMSVLSASNATLDSIHLSQTGHDQLADATWEIIDSAFVNASR